VITVKRTAVINDISGFGKCSLTAAIPILSVLGVECCPLVTAVLSNQTGYKSWHCTDLTGEMPKYLNEWKKLGYKFDSVLTGYMTGEKQADVIINAVKRFRSEGSLIVVDPVMADDGRLYSTYSKELCKKVIKLASLADIITPNLTELCILSQTSYKELTSHCNEEDYPLLVAEAAKKLLSDTLRTVIVTGVHFSNSICNIIVDCDVPTVIKSEIYPGSYSGTGDIFSSVVCGEITKGMSVDYAVRTACKLIERALRDTVREGTDRNDGIAFEKHLGVLINE
jgi:pyridoxine kinase